MALSRRVLFYMATNTAVELLRRQSTCAFARFCCSDCNFRLSSIVTECH
jgi:hypothetical protein